MSTDSLLCCRGDWQVRHLQELGRAAAYAGVACKGAGLATLTGLVLRCAAPPASDLLLVFEYGPGVHNSEN
eukprot:SAG25_NODE_4518_length_798_cov_1.367668_2_plen_71_part_00